MKSVLAFWLSVLLLLSVGCTRHIKPEKFDIYPELVKNFSGNIPVRVMVPENAEKMYLIEYKNPEQPSGKYTSICRTCMTSPRS